MEQMKSFLKAPPAPPHSTWDFGVRASITLQSHWVARPTPSSLGLIRVGLNVGQWPHWSLFHSRVQPQDPKAS